MNQALDTSFVAALRVDPPEYERSRIEAAVSSVLRLLGMDEVAGGSAGLLASIISPGDTVLLKPNMIRQSHLLNDDWDYVITHGEVVRAVALLAAKALQGRGRLVIADGPQTDSDFDSIARLMELERIRTEVLECHGIEVEVLDLREERWIERNGVTIRRLELCGDPAGYVEFDLADRSEFADYEACERLYGADYDTTVTRNAHTGGRHLYRLAGTPLAADVFINLPKMKTHKKTGVTLSLKNLVGIHGNRNYLPHFTVGGAAVGGDETPASGVWQAAQSGLVQWMKDRLARRGGVGGWWLRFVKGLGYRALGSTEEVVRSGNWHGNDTTWRMVLDLNKILLYGRSDGTLSHVPARRYLTVVDGIIAGDGNGPMAPDPKPVGLLVAGVNAVTVDTVCTVLMGFNPASLPMIANAWRAKGLPLVDCGIDAVECRSNVPEWNGDIKELMTAPHLGFAPHFGWIGAIERPPSVQP